MTRSKKNINNRVYPSLTDIMRGKALFYEDFKNLFGFIKWEYITVKSVSNIHIFLFFQLENYFASLKNPKLRVSRVLPIPHLIHSDIVLFFSGSSN